MGYAITNTSWPKSVPASVRDLLDRFFTLADTKDPNIGVKLAQDVFSPHGKFYARDRLYAGADEIAISRREAWTTVNERRHEVQKVYINDNQPETELILFGTLNSSLADGTQGIVQFVARTVIKEVEKDVPKIFLMSWTHLIRFIATEDDQIHLGQLVNTARDIGEDTLEGIEVLAYKIDGTCFNGKVTSQILRVKKLLSPISKEECPYIRGLGLNYSNHATESNIAGAATPDPFTKPRTSLAGPYPAPIVVPKVAQDGTPDYEGELCVIVGQDIRDVVSTKIPEYILGYTVANDVSARTIQLQASQYSMGKGLDGFCPIGPVLVSPKVISDPQSLSLQTTYNGEVVQTGFTKDMIWGVYDSLAYLSRGTTLEAGSILLTGTPAGVGYFRQPRVYLRDGDDIRVHISNIGTLINKVEYE
ncbi:fumarylacetoacetate hydrolase, putative [Paecilomyces variotii No. 5]|uniref:Fumarylacetoacetate hydrolase, putative n=1 Tax=Byssochlamys spectabilis (strain No. 5 / NBRC 109023) TaxID=1356009 RepID=V5G259_BYSSN|nr:fumarylacetoacetate hydrolase, putative [Paecilomyces variotii No. 5]